MKFNKKMLLATIGIGTALVLAGCGAKSHAHKSESATSPTTAKVVHHKSHRKHQFNGVKKSHTYARETQSANNKNNNSNTSISEPKASSSSTKSDSSTNMNGTPVAHSHNVNTSANNSTSPKVTKYVTTDKNNNTLPKAEIAGLPSVNLGDGITGYEDRGAGQEYIVFMINGKKYSVHGNDVQPGQSALPKAQAIVRSILG